MSKNTLDYAKSQLEWMSLGKIFDSSRINPFALKHIQICSSQRELERVTENGNPTCVLASGVTCDHGPARDLLLQWAENPDNAIVFTDSAPILTAISGRRHVVASQLQQQQQQQREGEAPDVTILGGELEDEATALVGSAITSQDEVSKLSTAAQLLHHWCQAKLEGREMEDVVEVDVLVPHRSPLRGAELKEFLAQEEAARKAQQAEEERRAMLEQVELAKGQLRLGEEEEKQKETPKSKATTTAIAVSSRPKKKSRFDSSLFIKFSKPLHSKYRTSLDTTLLQYYFMLMDSFCSVI
jgi:cleavage and polyadenylation specificity factor subunit 2